MEDMTFSARRKLASFADDLSREIDWRFDLNDFYDRIRMQKYLKLSEPFGFDHPYEYSMYIHGPYSPSSASDYYSNEFRKWHGSDSPPLTEFDTRSFRRLVMNRDRKWLEVAATIEFLDDRIESPNGLARDATLDQVIELKDVSRPEAGEIYRSLQKNDVLSQSK